MKSAQNQASGLNCCLADAGRAQPGQPTVYDGIYGNPYANPYGN